VTEPSDLPKGPQEEDEERRDDRISPVFYYFSQFTDIASGRTVGRKIGVVQEILLHQYFKSKPGLVPGLYLERKLEGKSTAQHKVEFCWFDHIVADVQVGRELPHIDDIAVTRVADGRATFEWTGGRKRLMEGAAGTAGGSGLRRHLTRQSRDFRVLAISEDGVCVSVSNTDALLVSLESKRVGAQRFSAGGQLGAGIQTIEKAKQVSLVALDLDLRYNGDLKCLANGTADRKCINGAVLGNGVRWTEKDHPVLRTYTDFVYLAEDKAIISYAEFVRALADASGADFRAFFMAYFSGMTTFPGDAFPVSDDDFTVVTPEQNTLSLGDLLLGHLDQFAGHSFA
jgi:hypothetical protein